MSTSLLLLDASAFWRLGSPQLEEVRRREVYDADFERLAAHTDLAALVEALAPLGTLP